MATIQCCHYCVPPKRHLACSATCPEYAADKAKMEAAKEAKRREMDVLNYNYNRNMTVKLQYMKHRRHLRDMSGRD